MISGISSSILTAIALELDRRRTNNKENRDDTISSLTQPSSPTVVSRAADTFSQKQERVADETLASPDNSGEKTEQQVEEEKEDRKELLELLQKIEENTRDGKKGAAKDEDKDKEGTGGLGTIGSLIGGAIALAISKKLGSGLMKIGAKIATKFPKIGGALGKFGAETAEIGIKKASGRAVRGGLSKVAEKVGAKGISAALKPAALAGGAAATGAGAAGISTATSGLASTGAAATGAGAAATGAGAAATGAGAAATGTGGFFSSIGNFFGKLKEGIKGLANPIEFLKANKKAIFSGLKKIPVLGTIFETILGSFNISEILSNPELSAKEKKQAIGTEIGARFGSLAGGVLGGALGSVIPVGGTLIGSIAGALGGEWLGGKVAEIVGPEGIYDVAHTFLGSLIDIPEESTAEEPNIPEPEVVPEPKPQEITPPPITPPPAIPQTTETKPLTGESSLPLTAAATTTALAAGTVGTATTVESSSPAPTATSGGSMNISAGNVTVTGAAAQPATTTINVPQLETAVSTEAKIKKEEIVEKKKERKELGLTKSIFGDSTIGTIAKYTTPMGVIDSLYGSAANEGGVLNTLGTGAISAVGSLSDAIFGRKQTEVENIPSKEGEYLAYITPVSAGGIPSIQGMASNDSSVLSRASETTNPTLLAAQSSKQSEGNVVNNYNNNVTQASQGFPDFSSMKARAGEATLDMLAASQNQFAAV